MDNEYASIIDATNYGDDLTFVLDNAPTTSVYYVVMNNATYFEDDATFGFSITGTTLTFDSTLPTDMASTDIKLVCIWLKKFYLQSFFSCCP